MWMIPQSTISEELTYGIGSGLMNGKKFCEYLRAGYLQYLPRSLPSIESEARVNGVQSVRFVRAGLVLLPLGSNLRFVFSTSLLKHLLDALTAWSALVASQPDLVVLLLEGKV
jgi:hypothetical protein